MEQCSARKGCYRLMSWYISSCFHPGLLHDTHPLRWHNLFNTFLDTRPCFLHHKLPDFFLIRKFGFEICDAQNGEPDEFSIVRLHELLWSMGRIFWITDEPIKQWGRDEGPVKGLCSDKRLDWRFGYLGLNGGCVWSWIIIAWQTRKGSHCSHWDERWWQRCSFLYFGMHCNFIFVLGDGHIKWYPGILFSRRGEVWGWCCPRTHKFAFFRSYTCFIFILAHPSFYIE